MNSSFPPNITDGTGAPFDVKDERIFLERLFASLEKRMGDNFHRFTFVVHFWRYGETKGSKVPIKLKQGDDNHVLILIADERAVFPLEDFMSYRVIFRAHGNPKGGKSRIYPFPIGYFNEAGTAESIPFEKRATSIFFSGYLNRNRVDVYKQFHPVWWLPKHNLPHNRYIRELLCRSLKKIHKQRNIVGSLPGARIRFTEWFGKGFHPEEYARILADSKISICPPGFIMSETIRHWEAMRLGCITISAPLPQIYFYRGGPIIELNDWSQLIPVLNELLSNPNRARELHEATVAWWKLKCSSVAIADYMARVIENPETTEG